MRILWIAIGLSSVVAAQETGRLSGLVLDQAGAAVPGASVSVLLPQGASSVLETRTTSEGLFHFPSIRAERYTLTVQAPGFRTQSVREVKVDPGRETTLPPLELELGAVNEVVEVAAQAENVQTSNFEVAVTLTNRFLDRLPTLDRNPMAFITSQAGVTVGRAETTVNGQRVSYANVTFEGINIQDNLIRSNGLDFQPNMLLQNQVAEMSIITSNQSAPAAGGSSQFILTAPSGTNSYHGNLFWSNRNNHFAANSWFNNRDRVNRPFLNQNQFGAALGGPVLKDRLLFYLNYEGLRLRQQSTANRTILTADARQGIFTYRDTAGSIRRVNILAATPNASVDPYIRDLIAKTPGPARINNFRVGDSTDALSRNSAGYSFLVRNNRTRDNATAKLDFNLSPRHVFSGTYAWNRDLIDRPDFSNNFDPAPGMINDDHTKLLSLGWRWTPSATLTNQLRGGFNFAPGVFEPQAAPPGFYLDGLVFSDPINRTEREGRYTDTYNLRDDASWVKGRHNLNFGIFRQGVRVQSFDEFDIVPTYSLGVTTSGNVGLTAAQLPGIGSSDLTAANNLLATLNGYIAGYNQTFNITNRTSGFVPGSANVRHYTLDNYAWYVQDDWKVHSRVTLNLGVRWDYYTPVDERDSLVLMPVTGNQNAAATLLNPNSRLDFAGRSAGRPWYGKDKNNFAPNAGFAWDLFGNGRTAVRGGYTLTYVNDELILATLNNLKTTNRGLSSDVVRTNLASTIRSGLPRIATPRFQVPRSFADNYFDDPTTAFGITDPNLRTPYVQQWSFGIQHDFRGNIVEARYVGNHSVGGWRGIDFNQVVVKENGFLNDFNRARNNGNLARQLTGVFDIRFNPNIAGSERLPVFGQLEQGGFQTDPLVRSFVDTGQVGELATTYQVFGLNGAVDFFRNPNALGANLLTNFAQSSYNSFQIDVRRRFSSVQYDVNYTFSKVLSNSSNDNQFRFEALLDRFNPAIERARSPFDIRHVFNQIGTFDLPFGAGRKYSAGAFWNRVIGGWSLSDWMYWQSGTPFSVLSGRATLNRASRSGATNTAVSTLNGSALNDLMGLRFTPSGPYYIAPSALGPDGRGVAADGAAPFAGQSFFNPNAGQLGTLQRRMFSGPSAFGVDFGLQKSTPIREGQSLNFRMDAVNVLNHPTFFVGDQNINSVNFGRVSSTFTGRRIIQFGLTYRF